MKKLPIFSFLIFVITLILVIIVFNTRVETFGETFVSQIRVADSDNTLTNVLDSELISIGKKICESSDNWTDENTSLLVIQDVLLAGDVTVDIEDRIIPIMRFQSTYELCPEYVSRLESLFVEK